MTTATRALTPRQQRILDFIREYIRREQRAPSVRNIMDGAGVSSTSVVTYNLRALARAGELWLKLDPRIGWGQSRGIVLLGPDCPYCGHPR